ncbi:LysR family transcriptional regulator [Pseudoxanthomonas winnipegensis]|jgi:DNA-binding transcriptional LysR family regulator|uniref:LysR family transcriptional regulator n=1 Tax=Pseudoxanthomonas winnipegensis TaxID=2480810 RepID=A0A4Q8L4P8_9GAMM|nr:LysR family transcriptional regulator [Pseudoxanthomonas winnipegensis]PZP59176.1 MAG: LysR family transcriptional regulator [Pseudoxanthomonas spadix]TAA20115.1 LysR family transcriptional regulator [Pseudoxanthomonas winnipegensis]
MTLRRIDLNLFRVFEAVLKHRSIVGASRELSITPSAVSHAIARLRASLADPLFVPCESGMEPTARALELAPHVQGGLERIDLALRSRPFVAHEAVRTFRLAMSDYAALTILPPLIQRLQTQAPGIDLRVFPFSRSDTVRQIDDGRLDLVVGWFTELPPRMRRVLLWKDVESIIARAGHPLAGRPVTREDLLRYPHVVVELTGSGDLHEEGYLAERGVTQRVWLERLLLDTREDGGAIIGRAALSVPHYAEVIPVVMASDMLATLPLGYTRPAVEQGQVVHIPLPYEPVVGTLEAIWHQRSDDDAALNWLIRQAREATGMFDQGKAEGGSSGH